MYGMAFVLGPPLAGVLMVALSWHWIFIANDMLKARKASLADAAETFARLNIKHGPNLAQPVSSLPEQGRDKLAEFDLAYVDLNDRRIEKVWLDLIVNDAAMTRIVIRDVVLSRRPRAEL